MTGTVHTTINIPQDLFIQAKMFSASNRLTFSDLVKEAVEKVITGEIILVKEMPKLGRFLVGSKLVKKAPYQSRSDVYADHIKRKLAGGY